MIVDGGVGLNVMSFLTSKKLGKNMEDLIQTNMKMASFTDEKSNDYGVLIPEFCFLCHTLSSLAGTGYIPMNVMYFYTSPKAHIS